MQFADSLNVWIIFCLTMGPHCLARNFDYSLMNSMSLCEFPIFSQANGKVETAIGTLKMHSTFVIRKAELKDFTIIDRESNTLHC